MPEETSKITIIADLLKRNPAYREVIDQLEERLYNRYIVYLADKPRFNEKTSAIPKQYMALILSFKNTLELNKIAKKYTLSQDQRDAIPNVLWKIFLREAEIKNLPQMLSGELKLENIRIAYQIALDIAPIYMPVSDYLGDLGMVMKRWQYETPAELAPTVPPVRPATPTPSSVIPAFSSVIPSTDEESRRLRDSSVASLPQNDDAKISQDPSVPARADDKSKIASPARNDGGQKDEPIARVQETMARISGQMAKIQSPAVIPSSPSAIPVRQQADETPAGIQPKSDIEPEYLPDEASAKAGLPDTPPTHSANIIDLKNF